MTAEIIPFPGRHKAKVIPIRDVTTGETILLPKAKSGTEAKADGWFEREMRAAMARVFGAQKPCDSE